MADMGSAPVKIEASVEPFSGNGFYSTNGLETTNGLVVSEELYWEHYYDNSDVIYEWNNGRLEEKPATDYVQYCLYLWFLHQLEDFLFVNPIARMIGLELGFRLALLHKTTIRRPDLGIVLNSNRVPLGDKDRFYRGIFDICIESISDSSPNDVERDTKVKKEEYALAGVTEYYILDERGSATAFYRLNASGFYVPIQPQGGVIHSKVLPGFQFRTRDLYRQPQPPQLIGDPVYQAFTSPHVRAERLRAEQAEERAEQAETRAKSAETRAKSAETRAKSAETRAKNVETRAKSAETRAERYAALLKSMGIAVDE